MATIQNKVKNFSDDENENRLVAFTYFDGHSNKSERTVEPY